MRQVPKLGDENWLCEKRIVEVFITSLGFGSNLSKIDWVTSPNTTGWAKMVSRDHRGGVLFHGNVSPGEVCFSLTLKNKITLW